MTFCNGVKRARDVSRCFNASLSSIKRRTNSSHVCSFFRYINSCGRSFYQKSRPDKCAVGYVDLHDQSNIVRDTSLKSPFAYLQKLCRVPSLYSLLFNPLKPSGHYMYQQVKLKVKYNLVQTLRLCTGRTAHRGSRNIALLFLDHGTRSGAWSASRPGRSLPPGKKQFSLNRRLGGVPWLVWRGEE